MADKQYQLDFTMTDGSVKSVTFVSPEGPQGERGLQGEPGFSPQVAVEPAAGEDGKTGVKLSITDAENTKNIYIYNGADGAPGADGADGFSPTVEVEPYSVISPPLEGSTEITTESGHIVTITDKEGAKQFYVLNGTPGVSPTVEVQGWGDVGEDDVERTGYELTITDKNGTESIILMNGDPGVSPTVEVQGWGDVDEDDVERTGYELTITDKNGTKNIILMNGEQGPKGETGDQGPDGVPGFSPRVSVEAFEETGEGGTRLTGNEITIVAANGTQIFRVYNGADGKDGEDGVDGGGNGADQEPLVVTVEPYYETDADAQEVEVGYQVTIEDASGPQDFVIRHGKTGAQGPQGSDGKSAYAYAQDGGFTGTEEEFASLLGESADWNAEEGEPGYIRNKPVYMGESGADTVILAPMNLPFDGEDGSTFIFFEKVDCFGRFEEGKTYRLVCNGNAQGCTAELITAGEDMAAYRFTADIYTVIINKADDLNPAKVTLYTEDSSFASVPTVQLGIYGPLEPVQRLSPLALPEGVPFRVEKTWTTILPNCQPVREDDGEAIFMTDACRNSPIAGETYEILWNGGKYHCLCQDASSLAPGALGFGDLTQMGLAGNGEPFMILILSPMAMVYNLESTALPILSIHGPAGVERMLDNGLLDLDWLPRYSAGEEYIPNTRVMATELQEISGMTLYTGALEGVEFDVSLGEKKPVVVEINGRRYRGVTYSTMDSMCISATGAPTAMLGGKYILIGVTSTTWRLYATEPGMYSVRVYKGEVSDTLPEEFLPESVDGVVIRSSTAGSTKKFKLTVDDSGTLTATEVTQ